MASIHEIAQNKPLAHPGVASIRLFDFDSAPPDHLKGIYGDVYRGLEPEVYPNAPRKIAHLLPREHGKSATMMVCIVWAILRDPDLRVLVMSESATQAKNKLREIRDHVERLAPQFGHEIDTDNSTELTLERDANWDVPTVKAAGLNSGVTGGHYDVVLFDDVISYKSQRTTSRRETVWKTFQERLNLKSGTNTLFIVLGTRKHPQDLYSRLIDSPAWDVTVEQAISDFSVIENREFDIVTAAGKRYDSLGDIDPSMETVTGIEPHRDVPVLWDERHPLDSLILDYLSAGHDGTAPVWVRENQNDARALMGQILNPDMLKYVSAGEVPDDLTWFVGIDLAVEADPEKAATNDTDFFSLSVIGYHKQSDTSYLHEVTRRRGMSLSQAVSWASGLLTDYDTANILAESNQAQRWFVETAEDAGLDVEETTSTGKKEDRIMSMMTRFENGNVKLVEGEGMEDSWTAFESEVATFPSGHDDQLDSTEIALRGVQNADSGEFSYGFITS